MNAHRGDTDRRVDESGERMWRVYADEIGIPDSAPADRHDSLSPQADGTVQRSPGHFVGALVLVVVAIVLGVAVWRGLRSPGPSSLASAPPTDVTQTIPEDRTIPQRKIGGTALPGPKPRGRTLLHQVSFDFASDHLNNDAKIGLDKVAATLNANVEWRVAIEGHTDPHGTPDYNRSLSERRARTVTVYLQSSGIVPERLRALGLSASRPVASNDPVGNARNRRVEIYRE
jgi:outer membrane protein OmpA-like peptidoglycan-associated protein